MDGVLLDSRPAVERVRRRWAARHGISVAAILSAPHGQRVLDTIRALAPELATAQEGAWLEAAEMADLDGIVPIAGATELVTALDPASWTVVTSAGRELATRRLAAVGLVLPSHAVTGDEVQQGKPAPEGYLLAARRLGVSPADCLVVEDAPAGVQAGLVAGSRVLALTTTYAQDALLQATFIVPDLLAVRTTRETGRLGLAIETGSRAT